MKVCEFKQNVVVTSFAIKTHVGLIPFEQNRLRQDFQKLS